MCQPGESVVEVDSALSTPAQEVSIKTKQLNHQAEEFRSDSSSSACSSPGRRGTPPGGASPPSVIMDAVSRGGRRDEFIVSPQTAAAMPRTGSGQLRQDRAQTAPRGRQAWGWESPQAQLHATMPPPPIEQLMVPPTRQLSLRVGQEEDLGLLREHLARFGELRDFDASRRAREGQVVASFFDIRGAIAAHDALASPAPPVPPRSVRFVPLGGASGSEGEAEGPADTAAEPAAPAGILAVEVTEGELARDVLGRACAAHGEVCGVWGSGSLFFVEFMDTRSADKALAALAADAPAGCQLAVRHADLDPIVLLGRSSSVAHVAARMRGSMPGPPARTDSFGGRASPPLILPPGSPPPMVMPVMPAYSWGAAYPVFHCYPPEVGPMERAASPPAVYPVGGSPPLPSGFISVPVRTGSGALYGGSPTYGGSPVYGSSPTHHHGMMYMAAPPPMFDAVGNPVMVAAGGPGEFGVGPRYMAPGGQADLMQRLSGMGLGAGGGGAAQQGQQGQQQDKPQRSDSRASARIARSHRAGGAYDPQEFAFSLEEAESGRAGARATVMIRNIPNKYTQAVMLEVLDKSGFKGHFDFFYLPIDFRNKCNLGYAFLNFTSAAAAGRLYKQYHNKRWEEYNSKKVCEISYARVQGRDPLIEHFRASKFPSEDLEYMPLVYTQVTEEGLCTRPLSIHQFLAAQQQQQQQHQQQQAADEPSPQEAAAEE